MKISRRKFLEATPLAVGAALQLKGLALGQGPGKQPLGGGYTIDRLSQLSWASFYPYIYTDFSFTGKERRDIALKLTAMADTRPADFKAAAGQECFTMTFSGPLNRPLTQDTYSVSHFALGNFRLFITDGERGRKNSIYTAVINRIVG